jgi:hypothetical protein
MLKAKTVQIEHIRSATLRASSLATCRGFLLAASLGKYAAEQGVKAVARTCEPNGPN